ncbi:MAG: DNA-processing protein DprA [Phycisphaeraceae bacterium]|nr:DNA-processing protein DprA [Phycisphaeraceae bacterium]
MTDLRDLLRLTLTPGMGPVFIARLLAAFGTPDRILAASASELERVKGIGPGRAASFVKGMRESASLVDAELDLAARLGVSIIPLSDPAYPPLLRQIHDPPPLLYARGTIDPAKADRFPVAIVGSRNATAYGIEQAERFAGVLARSGLTIVSGGARGVDTAAHRGAARSDGRTIIVVGCGLAECYPPENREFFDKLVANGHGAIVSELPLAAPPESDNFPARNRLISGISLGVLVIEAGRKSGSLITARLAAEDHGREVMAVPGRVDSPASAGTLELIKNGGAALVMEPGDVLNTLETPARHSHAGTHESRYADPRTADEHLQPATQAIESKPLPINGLTKEQISILQALSEPRTLDELARDTGLSPSCIRAEMTILELQRRITRQGSRISRRAP